MLVPQLDQYLSELERICRALSRRGMKVFIALAAAVSDFRVPAHVQPQAKLRADGESGTNAVSLQLEKVESRLRALVEEWCSEAYVAAFKLVTSTQVLEDEAVRLLKDSGVSIVVGNYLSSRRRECSVFELSRDGDVRREELRCNEGTEDESVTMERKIVDTMLRREEERRLLD